MASVIEELNFNFLFKQPHMVSGYCVESTEIC